MARCPHTMKVQHIDGRVVCCNCGKVMRREFLGGHEVEVLDRNGSVIGKQTVTGTTARRVYTDDGRCWTQGGQWWDGDTAWPFPSIRHATV